MTRTPQYLKEGFAPYGRGRIKCRCGTVISSNAFARAAHRCPEPDPKPLYRTAFPDFPVRDWPATIPAGFVDSSWRNDSCPSLFHEGTETQIFIDYSDVSKREHDGPRFSMRSGDPAEGVSANEFSSDDWEEVFAFASLAIMSPAELNDWYESNVGYRPQVDDPSLTDDQLRGRCIEMADEYRLNGEAIKWTADRC